MMGAERLLRWSHKDDITLLKHVSMLGCSDWAAAAAALCCGPGAAAARWYTIVSTAWSATEPSSRRVSWSQFELDVLLAGYTYSRRPGVQISSVDFYTGLAKYLPGRSPTAVKQMVCARTAAEYIKQQERRPSVRRARDQHLLQQQQSHQALMALDNVLMECLQEPLAKAPAAEACTAAELLLSSMQHNGVVVPSPMLHASLHALYTAAFGPMCNQLSTAAAPPASACNQSQQQQQQQQLSMTTAAPLAPPGAVSSESPSAQSAGALSLTQLGVRWPSGALIDNAVSVPGAEAIAGGSTDVWSALQQQQQQQQQQNSSQVPSRQASAQLIQKVLLQLSSLQQTAQVDGDAGHAASHRWVTADQQQQQQQQLLLLLQQRAIKRPRLSSEGNGQQGSRAFAGAAPSPSPSAASGCREAATSTLAAGATTTVAQPAAAAQAAPGLQVQAAHGTVADFGPQQQQQQQEEEAQQRGWCPIQEAQQQLMLELMIEQQMKHAEQQGKALPVLPTPLSHAGGLLLSSGVPGGGSSSSGGGGGGMPLLLQQQPQQQPQHHSGGGAGPGASSSAPQSAAGHAQRLASLAALLDLMQHPVDQGARRQLLLQFLRLPAGPQQGGPERRQTGQGEGCGGPAPTPAVASGAAAGAADLITDLLQPEVQDEQLLLEELLRYCEELPPRSPRSPRSPQQQQQQQQQQRQLHGDNQPQHQVQLTIADGAHQQQD